MLIFLIIAFQVKHFLADFVLQTPYQYLNKGKFLHFGGILHALIHGLFTSAITAYFSNDIILVGVLGLIDFTFHYYIDLCKTQWTAHKNYSSYTLNNEVIIKSNKYFVALGLDQLAHQLCYALFIACLYH